MQFNHHTSQHQQENNLIPTVGGSQQSVVFNSIVDANQNTMSSQLNSQQRTFPSQGNNVTTIPKLNRSTIVSQPFTSQLSSQRKTQIPFSQKKPVIIPRPNQINSHKQQTQSTTTNSGLTKLPVPPKIQIKGPSTPIKSTQSRTINLKPQQVQITPLSLDQTYSTQNVPMYEQKSFISPFLSKPQTTITQNKLKRTDTLERNGIQNTQSITVFIPKANSRDSTSIETNTISEFIFHTAIVQFYHKRGVKRLFDWQVECLRKEEVLNGAKHFIYSAPTSAGKTLVSEVMMVRRLVKTQRKQIFIVPYVSLVHEKQKYFMQLLQSLAVTVVGFYSSKHIHTNFDVAVCTIEKANALINKMALEKTIPNISTVIVDEIHMVGDSSRGYLLELLLCKLKYLNCKTLQIIGMSATVPDLSIFKTWLDASIFITEYRPVLLEEFIVTGKEVFNIDGTNKRVLHGNKDIDNILELVTEVTDQGLGVLCFCQSKRSCEDVSKEMIFELGKRNLILNKNQDTEIAREELLAELKSSPLGLDPLLEQSIPFGIAHHHAGITTEERDLIESSFRAGGISLILATSTLAVGVNLPATRVIFRSPRIALFDLDVTRYRQMAGRAGRYGLDSHGESYLFCNKSNFKKTQEMTVQELPPMKQDSEEDEMTQLAQSILEAIHDNIVETDSDVRRYCRCSLHSFKSDFGSNTQTQTQHDNDRITNSLLLLTQKKFIEEVIIDEITVLRSTPLGSSTVLSTLSPTDAVILHQQLSEALPSLNLTNDLHVLFLVAPLTITFEPSWDIYERILDELPPQELEVSKKLHVDINFVMKCQNDKTSARSVQSNCSGKSFAELSKPTKALVHRKFFYAIILADILNEVSLTAISERYEVPRGNIQALQQQTTAFASVVAQFCTQLGFDHLSAIFQNIVERLKYGAKEELFELVRIPGVKTRRARALYEKGIKTLEDVAKANEDVISRILLTTIPKKDNLGYVKQYHVKLAKDIIKKAQELLGGDKEIKMINAVLNGNKKELDKVPSFRRSLSVTDEIKIVYVADLCKNDMGLLEKLKNEQQLIGIYVDVNNEFIGRRFKGICIGTKQWGYYIKYHSPCGNDCLFQTTFFPLIMNNTSNKSFVTFDAKQLYVQMLLTNNSILSSQHIHDVLLDYWAVHATSLTNNRRVELSINIIREAYKEKLTSHLPSLEIGNFSDVEKDYGHETLVISSYRNILESYEHCLVVLGLSELLSNDISSLQYNKFYKEIDCPLTPIISKIEVTGIAFDIRKCKEIAQDVNKEMEVLKQKIFSICGPHFNFESSTELYNYFFEKHDFTYPTKIHEYKAKRNVQNNIVNNDVLETLIDKSDAAKILLEYRRLGEFKINSITELVHYAEEEARKENNQNNIVRIHCKYSQVKKTSGWLTTQTPNLMNILRTYNFLTKDKNITIQSCFCAKTNHVLVSVDLKQLLPRVLIQKSGIIEALDTPNVFTYFASRMYQEEEVTISHYKQEVIQQIFSIIIHHTKKRIVARRLKTSKQEVKRLYEQFRKTFPQIIRYVENIYDRLKNETIESINHRIRQLTSPKKRIQCGSKEEKYLQHQIIDTTIIASSAELYKQTLLQLSTHLKNYQSTIALLLYDEILFEVQEEDIMEISKIIKEVVKTSMESTLKMEIIIKQGKRWDDMNVVIC